MDLYQGLNYLYYTFFTVVLVFLVTELIYKVSSESLKMKISNFIMSLRKVYFIACILILYASVSLLYYNGYRIIGNNLYYSSITRDVFIGISLSFAYIPILYAYIRTSEFHSNSSNVFTRNKFRYIFDMLVFGFAILVFILNSSLI